MLELTAEEINHLEDYLLAHAYPEKGMNFEMLDGLLVAIHAGPLLVAEEEWLPLVFGEAGIPADLPADILGLIHQHDQWIAAEFQPKEREQMDENPIYAPLIAHLAESEEPLTPEDEAWLEHIGEGWAAGFHAGMLLRVEEWEMGMDEDDELGDLIGDILMLEFGHHPYRQTEILDRDTRADRIDELPWLIEEIYFKWLERRFQVQTVVNTTDKAGRNDPCPCGSGKKYKKCCGA